jgi:hypothetical protein
MKNLKLVLTGLLTIILLSSCIHKREDREINKTKVNKEETNNIFNPLDKAFGSLNSPLIINVGTDFIEIYYTDTIKNITYSRVYNRNIVDEDSNSIVLFKDQLVFKNENKYVSYDSNRRDSDIIKN